MEDIKSNEFIRWATGQDAHTRTLLARLSIRGELFERISVLAARRDEATNVRVRAGKLFYLKRLGQEEVFKLYVRDLAHGRERMLIDPGLDRSQGVGSIDFYEPSPAGHYVAFGVSANGSENPVLRVLDVEAGTLLLDTIDRARHAEPHWLPDERSFFYRRNPKPSLDAPSSAKYQGSRDYLHVLGNTSDKDVAVFGFNVSSGAPLGMAESPYVYFWPDCSYMFGVIQHGTSNDLTIYVAPLASLDGARTPWKKLVGIEDQVLDWTVHGRDVFLLTHRDAPRSKVIRTSLDAPDLTHAETVVGPGKGIVDGLAAARDALYVQTTEDGVGHLIRVPFDGASARELALPFSATIGDLAAVPAAPGVTFQLQSWTQPRIYYAYDPATDHLRDLGLFPAVQPQPLELESVETMARSKDGTMVPLSIVYVRGIDRGQPHPTLLTGYGSYGVSLRPNFDVRRLAWLERGGIYAVAHVRGGGEFGEEWHHAGMKGNKQNTIDDFMACARLLISDGYTSAARLAVEGTSAGGITIGGAITQHPELFAAALVRVGIMDAVRFETTALGPQNAREFGSSAVREEFKALYDMSPYYHVVDGGCFPAVLFTAAAYDARVPVWQPAKMAARLQAATASGRPILLRLDGQAGHGYGVGTMNSQLNAELADCYAFLWWQLDSARDRSDKEGTTCKRSTN